MIVARSEPTDDEILILWRHGQNTREIAIRFLVPEHYIAGRLPRILQAERQAHEWNLHEGRA